MPSLTSASAAAKPSLPAILAAARPFLAGDLAAVDPNLPSLISVLRSAGAGECWHKHGSFLAHLADVHRILALWSAPAAVVRCGLFHSAYSNSYLNLALFDASAGARDDVRRLIGDDAERLVHLFCVVDRQILIFDDLLFQYPSDEGITRDLADSAASVNRMREDGVFDEAEMWRVRVRSVLPADGVKVRNIKTGEEVALSRRVVATFLMMTMADFSDQWFGFQDQLFGNDNGRLDFSGNNWATLWPGDGKPGLCMNSISRMGAIYLLIAREEEMYIEERKRGGGMWSGSNRDEEMELVIPPVFDGCTRVVDAAAQVEARDLYWEAVRGGSSSSGEEAVGLLKGSCEKNPFVGEPWLVLGQALLGMGRYEEAEKAAEKGLRLLLEWGSSWDKRTSWEGWAAWGRVLLMKAKEGSWPDSPWGILNLGLVR